MRPWEEVYKFCGEADVIVDDECAEALLWDGGLSRTQIAAAGGMSCQKIGTSVRQFAPNAVIVISRALIGETVHSIEYLVKSVGWQSVFTAASGASHLNFHGVSDVPEAEMFAQFSERLRDWNPSIMRAETVSLPSLLCRNFLPQDGSDKNDLIAVAPFAIPVYLPSEIEKLSKMDLPVSFGSLSFFALDKIAQGEVLSFSKMIGSEISAELDVWSAGDMAKLVANQLIKNSISGSNRKVAVLVFDSIIDVGSDFGESDIAFDELFSEDDPLKPKKLKNTEFLVNLQRPKTDKEAQLFQALMKQNLGVCRKISEIILDEIIEEEGLSSTAEIKNKIEVIKKNPDIISYNAGIVSSHLFMSSVEKKCTMPVLASGISTNERMEKLIKFLKTDIENMDSSKLLNYIFLQLSLTDVRSIDEDLIALVQSGLCIYLEGLDTHKRQKIFPYFSLKNIDLDLIDIGKSIEHLFRKMMSDVQMCHKRFGGFGVSQILEHILAGMPNPNFLEHHEIGLMGRLASGFGGFFGSTAPPKNARDYNEIYVVKIGGLSFAEINRLSLLGEKFGKKIRILTNSVNTSFYDSFLSS